MLLRLLPIICLTLGGSAACADDQLYELGGGAEYYTLKEFNGIGDRLVREEGILPGVRLHWRERGEHITFRLDGSLSGGMIRYDGQTQSGTPHTTDGYHLLPEIGAGAEWPSQQRLRAYGRLTFAADYRYLNNKGLVAGATEFYQRLDLGLGLTGDIWRDGNRSLTLWAARVEPLKSIVDVYSRTGSDDLSLTLDAGKGWEAGAAYVWTSSRQRQWLLRAACRDLRLDPSDPVPVTVNGIPNGTAVYQPEIHFHRCGLNLGVRMPLASIPAN
ncbi:MAG TPA: hypothetical protein VFW42_01255 [Fluviicoccus sp.]|nr:hypothetical protein [Fluviicoccus sp.]